MICSLRGFVLKKRLPVWSRLAGKVAGTRRAPETALIVPDALLALQNGETLAGTPGKLAEADLALQELILKMMR